MVQRNFGELNGSAIGNIMRDLVRRAISVIRLERFSFEAENKESDTGRPDFVTTADRKAQQLYVEGLTRSFPCIGILAEEENLRVPCRIDGRDYCFTIDPLDGTKAFMRRQSHGVATQIALVDFTGGCAGDVVAAYVGDVCTQEIYGFEPESQEVVRISEYEYAQPLHTIDRNRSLTEQFVQLRTMPDEHHPLIEALVRKSTRGGLVKGAEVHSGSIGLTLSRLWKGSKVRNDAGGSEHRGTGRNIGERIIIYDPRF